jgi:hypothetical protein
MSSLLLSCIAEQTMRRMQPSTPLSDDHASEGESSNGAKPAIEPIAG